jgi:tetratricopeptide (TPR) repeat protein
MKSIFLIVICFFQGFIFAQVNTKEPRLDADPKAFEFAQIGQTRNYSWQEILDIALWASGADYSNENAVKTSIIVSAESLPTSNELPPNKNNQGEYLLDYMHRTFLRNYSERQTRLDVLVNTGRFNCVSSAVLYSILASSIELETNGILTKDHAFVQVNIGAELIDVETTNSYGYNPGSKKDFHDGFGNTTGFAYVAPRNYRDRAAISQLELVSLILTNRIADLESRNFFADAVGIAIDRAALLSARGNQSSSPFFTDPEKDVLDRIFNYGASLIQDGNEEEALTWADKAENRYPDDRWQNFVFTAANNHLAKMIQSKKVADARFFLDTEANRFNPENYTKLQTLVTDAEIVQLTSSISSSEETELALEKLSQIETQNIVSAERILELRTLVVLKESERRAKNANWLEAIIYLESAVNNYRNVPELQKALALYKNNRAIDFHNQFAALFNARKFDEAKQILQNALEEFPGNRQLSSDLRMVERAMNQH